MVCEACITELSAEKALNECQWACCDDGGNDSDDGDDDDYDDKDSMPKEDFGKLFWGVLSSVTRNLKLFFCFTI